MAGLFLRVLQIAAGLLGATALDSQDIGRRWFHSVVVANDWLYIDGGSVSLLSAYGNLTGVSPDIAWGNVTSAPANDTLAINLSKDWTNSTLEITPTTRPSLAPVALDFQNLWWDERKNVIYCFGGEKSRLPQRSSVPTPANSIWGFMPDGNGSGAWNQSVGPAAETAYPQNISRPSNGISASDGTTGYFLGGVVGANTDPSLHGSFVFSPGLLKFDFDSGLLQNSTNVPTAIYAWARAGQMISVPAFGRNGTLIAMGGGPGQSELGTGAFNNITIFDIAVQKWLSQTATGEIPTPRSNFCAVGVQGGDNNTFEIFVYGGYYNGATGIDIPDSDFYILSLPAFRWFKVQNPSSDRRGYHTCNLAGNNQMIIIGGYDFTHSAYPLQSPPDPWKQQINVFDMSALQWKDKFESSAEPYKPPEPVTQYYNQASSRYPSTWTSTAAQRLFEDEDETSGNSTGSSPTATPSPLPEQHSRLSGGVIAGISVGCSIGVLLLLAIAAGWLIKLRKRRRTTTVPLSVGAEKRPQELDSHAQHRPHEMSHLFQPELRGDAGGMEIDGQPVQELGVPPSEVA